MEDMISQVVQSSLQVFDLVSTAMGSTGSLTHILDHPDLLPLLYQGNQFQYIF